MKNVFLFLTVAFGVVFNPALPFQAKASDGFVLNNISNTHTLPQISLPVSDSSTYREARIWFLPDWQAGGSGDRYEDRFKDRHQEGSGGDRTNYNCKTYGFEDSCSWPKVSTGKVRPRQGLVCDKACICDKSFQYNSDNSPADRWILGSSVCDNNSDSRSPKPCAENYTVGLSNCNGKAFPAGWTYHQEGYSGNEVCGKCTAKSCSDSSYTAGVNDCSGKAHPEGWTYSNNGYAGDAVCGKCTAKTCGIGLTAKLESCSAKIHADGWKYTSDGYAGDDICGKCTALVCAEGYTSGLSDCKAKAEPHYWKYDTKGWNGDAVCGRCVEMTCTEKNALCGSGTLNLDYYYADGALRCLMK